MTAALRSNPRRVQPSAQRAFWWRHPELPAAAVAGASWIVIGVSHFRGHATSNESWTFGPPSWMLMVIAMMLPAALADIRLISFKSLWGRRHRSPAVFAMTYLGVWSALGFAAAGLVATVETSTGLRFDPGRWTVVTALIVGVWWQLTATKRQFLYRCHLEQPIAPRGWKSDRSLIRYGWFHGRACVGSCWPVMLAMFLSAHAFHIMLPLAAVTITERYQRRPTLQAGAAAIAAVALITAIAPLH